MDVASGIDRHPDSRNLFQIADTFLEVFSYPYISFFHLLVNIFCEVTVGGDDHRLRS